MAVIDAWMQHPTGSFLRGPMFDSLRRWIGMSADQIPDEIPLELTLGAMDAGGVGGHVGYPWTTEMIALATKYTFPIIQPEACLEGLDDETRSAFLRGNAERVFGLGS